MSEIVSVDDLLALPDAEEIEREVVLPNGKTIIIRALSLGEHREIAQNSTTAEGTLDEARWQALVLHYGIKEPRLTFDQAEKLTRKPAGLVSSIVVSILELSGLTASGGISASVVERDEALFRGK